MRDGPSIAVGVYAALHAVAVLHPASFWGVDVAAWGSPVLTIAAALLLVPLLIGSVRCRLAAAAMRRAPDPWSSVPRTVLLSASLVVALAVAFVAFPSAVHLLGDGLLVLGNLDTWAGLGHHFDEIQWTTNNAPLGTLVLFAAQRAVRAAGGDAVTTLRVVDLATGVVWTILSVGAARFFARDASARWMLLAFLLTGGWLALFFGHVEVYAIVLPVVLAFLVEGGRAVRARRFPLGAAALLGVAAVVHTESVTLLPALLLVAVVGGPARVASQAARVGGALLVCAGAAALIARLIAFDVPGYLGAPHLGNFFPLFAEPTFRHAYRLFAPAHFVDVANQLLLVAPVAVLGAAFVSWRTVARGPSAVEFFYLVAAAAGPLLFLCVANPEIGAFRDWDTLAFTGVPLTLLVGTALGHRPSSGRNAGLGWALAGAAAAHTALWIGLNADGARSEARFLALLETAPVSRHARGYGWETAGTYFREAGRNEEAGRAYERALDALPENPRLWTLAGESHLKGGRYAQAQEFFSRALELDPRNVPALAGRGAVFANLGDWERAVAPLESAVALIPAFHPAWYNLAVARKHLGRTDDAELALRAAVDAAPSFAPAWLELGRLLVESDRTDEARAAFVRFLELAPSAPEATAIRAALRTEEAQGAR